MMGDVTLSLGKLAQRMLIYNLDLKMSKKNCQRAPSAIFIRVGL
jgi:hypothetical protein